MTVSELIDELKKLPADARVIMQKDSEGNGYSPLYAVDGNAIYREETTWSGEVFDADWSSYDAGFESDEEWVNFRNNNPRCCVLQPVN